MTVRTGYVSMVCCAATIATIMVSTGCHRGYYRRQADAEATNLIREKLNDPRWSQLSPSIAIQPDSRMHDPFSADHPPLPPDDPASHDLMHCVDDKPGYQHWHVNGDTDYVANPEWRSYLPLNPEGVLVLDLESAVRMSLLHAPTLQEQNESLYLSALDVSLQRFGFDSQAFYGLSSFFRTQGRSATGGAQSSVNLTPGPNRTRFEKLGINGANLVVGIANTIVWNFAGANTQTANTVLDFSLIQPLLSGAGRQIVMESLSQAERTLLANVRQLERFRRGFFLNVTTGRNAGAGVNRNGGFLNEPGGGSGNAGGFLGLLETQQEIRIAAFNVQSLEGVLEQFREFFAEQRINLLQVRQSESSLYRGQQALLRLKVQYQNDLDSFKRTLGLPPELAIEIDDPFLQQFELIDDELLQRQFEINALRDQIGLVLSKINPKSDDGSFDKDEVLEWSDELGESVQTIVPVLEMFTPYFEKLEGVDQQLVEKDIAKLESVTDQREESLEKLRDSIERSEIEYVIEPSVLASESVIPAGQLRNELEELNIKIANIKESYALLLENIEKLGEEGPDLSSEKLKERLESDIIFEAPELLTRVADAIVEMTLIQARARTNSISLPEVDLDSRTATAIACQFRRDLMNARASLVDRWRRIELVADDLESTLDVVFEGSVGSNTDNPFKLNWNTNQFGIGLRFDAPINRLTERNAYREALINYQQARRDFYGVEDSISQNLRNTLRSIEQNKVLFELNRRSIAVAVEQVELARFKLVEPVRSGAGGARQNSLGPTAATDLTNALNSLQSAQNDFLNVWVTHEVLRRGLDFDLGTMQLTPDGFWLDPGTINAMYAYRAAEAFGLPPESICLPPDLQAFQGSQDEDGLAPSEAGTETEARSELDTDSEKADDYYDGNDDESLPALDSGANRSPAKGLLKNLRLSRKAG